MRRHKLKKGDRVKVVIHRAQCGMADGEARTRTGTVGYVNIRRRNSQPDIMLDVPYELPHDVTALKYFLIPPFDLFTIKRNLSTER